MPQFPTNVRPPLGVIYDSNFGASIDTVLALFLLEALAGKRECRVVSLSTSSSNLKSAQLIDLIEKYYAGPNPSPFFSSLSIGLAVDAKLTADPILPTANPRITKLNDTAEVAALIRNAFTAQHDGNAVVVLAGPATNLLSAMSLPNMKPLIEKKVRGLYTTDPAAAKQLSGVWPTPITLVQPESVPLTLVFPPESPLAGVLIPPDSPTTALAAALQAVRPKGERTGAIYADLITAKPVPRVFRRPQVAAEDKKDEPLQKGDAAPPK
jgi:hypothetical protein